MPFHNAVNDRRQIGMLTCLVVMTIKLSSMEQDGSPS